MEEKKEAKYRHKSRRSLARHVEERRISSPSPWLEARLSPDGKKKKKKRSLAPLERNAKRGDTERPKWHFFTLLTAIVVENKQTNKKRRSKTKRAANAHTHTHHSTKKRGNRKGEKEKKKKAKDQSEQNTSTAASSLFFCAHWENVKKKKSSTSRDVSPSVTQKHGAVFTCSYEQGKWHHRCDDLKEAKDEKGWEKKNESGK